MSALLLHEVDSGLDTVVSLYPSSTLAFRLFPIAHKYEMPGILRWCTQAVVSARTIPFRSGPSSVFSPSPPPQPEGGINFAPDLFQWLAAADERNFAPIVDACLERLRQAVPSGGATAVREALCCVKQGALIEGLRTETKARLMYPMAGLPPHGHKVRFQYVCVAYSNAVD